MPNGRVDHETEGHYRKIREWLKVCDTVHKHYPKEYYSLVFSDSRDQEFRKRVKKLYNQIMVGSTGTCGGAL